METLTARLLERDLRMEDALTCQMLFRQELRASLLRELNGVSGCWTGDAGGTHFFWGLDRRTVLFPLRLRESAGTAELLEQFVSTPEVEASLQGSVAAALEHLN